MIAVLRREQATSRKMLLVTHRALEERFREHHNAITARRAAFEAQAQFVNSRKYSTEKMSDGMRKDFETLVAQNVILRERVSVLDDDLTKMTKAASENLQNMLSASRTVDPLVIHTARVFSRLTRDASQACASLRSVALSNFGQMMSDLRGFPALFKRQLDTWEQGVRLQAGKELCAADRERVSSLEEKVSTVIVFLQKHSELFAASSEVLLALRELKGLTAPSRIESKKAIELRVPNLPAVLRAFTTLDVVVRVVLGEPVELPTSTGNHTEETRVFDELRRMIESQREEIERLNASVPQAVEEARQLSALQIEQAQAAQYRQIESLKMTVVQLQKQLQESNKALQLSHSRTLEQPVPVTEKKIRCSGC